MLSLNACNVLESVVINFIMPQSVLFVALALVCHINRIGNGNKL